MLKISIQNYIYCYFIIISIFAIKAIILIIRKVWESYLFFANNWKQINSKVKNQYHFMFKNNFWYYVSMAQNIFYSK